MAYKRIGDLLLEAGAITQEDLNRALILQKGTGKRLGDVLIDNNIISETQFREVLQMQLGVEFVDLGKAPLSPELTKFVPKSIAKKHTIVPVKVAKSELYIAMADPLNFMAIEDVKRSSHHKVVPMIASKDAINRAIATLYGNEGAARAIEEMRREAGDENDYKNITEASVLDESISAAPTIRLVNSIVERAVVERASDIHLEPREVEMYVRMRIDGSLRNVLTVPGNLQESVIARLKVMGGMNTSERRIPQDGRANVIVRSTAIDLRISTLPTIYGEKMVIRLLDKAAQVLTRDGIGMDLETQKRFDILMRNTSGVFLIAGPTGSGKSSTMSTMIHELNKEGVNIVTLEDPVEYNIDGVNQVQINEKTGMTFASGLRSILRQDPDIIEVGEIRDGETAEIAMRAAVTGHLVLSTIHTSDGIATLDRLVDMGVPPYLTSAALRGVIAQRLIRKLCPDCSEEYEPTDEELELLGMERTPGLKLHRGRGCPNCYHTGYKGRTGVFEVFLVNGKIRRLISSQAKRDEIMDAAKADDFITIADSCRALVLEGITSADEAIKTIHSTDD